MVALAAAPVRILHLEDNLRDAELIQDHLKSGGLDCVITRAATGTEFLSALKSAVDLCLLDYGIAGYGGQAALAALREHCPDVPVIVVTGVLGEDAAVEWLHWGATDYVLKQRLAKLIPAVRRALAEAAQTLSRRQTEQELAHAQAAAKIGTWAYDIAEKRFRCSTEVNRIWGIEFGPSLNLDQSLERVHSEDRAKVGDAWAAAFGGQASYELVYRIEVRGQQKWIYGRGDVVLDAYGRAERVIGLTQDITDRERDRHALIVSENFINATLSALSDPIAVLDGRGRIVKSNPAWERLSSDAGPPPSSSLGFPEYLAQLAGAGLIEDADFAEDIRDLLGSAQSRKASRILQFTSLERWYLCRGVRFDFAGEVRIVISYTDITARRQAEEALRELNVNLEGTVRSRTLELQLANGLLADKENEIRSVLDNLLSCVISIDSHGYIQWANQAVEDVLGYAVSEVIGKNVSMLMPPLEADRHEHYVSSYMKTGEAKIIGVGRELQGLHKDGTPIALDISISEYFIGDKRFFTGILRDNRERNRILNDLHSARDEALQASRAKSEFLAVMSHEIRTPMNGVIGMLDVLRVSALKQEQQEMVDLIHESAYSLLHVINDILDYSKIEAGRMELEQNPVDVESVLESVCAMMDRMAMNARVELTYYVDPQLPRVILGDDARVRQVLVNLIGNAIKFSGSRRETGIVKIHVLSAPDNAIWIKIADNGIGMDAHTVASLFTPFTQADLSTTRRFGGTGLGLAISQHLITAMGGEVTVQSTVGEGSTFTILLPAIEAPPFSSRSQKRTLDGVRCRVLGSEDSIADALASYLIAEGAIVQRVASEGPESYMGEEIIDLIVCDIGAGKPASAQWQRLLESTATRLLLIERGRRRTPRRLSSHIFTIDGNGLSRARFLAVAAEATDRAAAQEPAKAERLERKPSVLSRTELEQRGRLILVAEDNEINQRVILAQLEVLGLVADVATDGREALSRWQSGTYGLLFTDLHMPGMDGYQLARAIRAQEGTAKRAPIIALTANAVKGEADKCRDAGMDDYLTKPLPLDQLQATLTRWLPALEAIHTTPTKQPQHENSQPAGRINPPAVDLSVLIELMGGNEAAAMEILHDFVGQSAQSARDLRAFIDAGDCKHAAELAHKMKSSARAMGAADLGHVCEEIEQQGRAGAETALVALLRRFDGAFADVDAFIKKL